MVSQRELLAMFVALLISPSTDAAILEVDPNGGADFLDIQVAIDAAEDGDTVLAKPGLYLVSQPLTFRGKAITVRAEKGPSRTSIRRSEPPIDQEGGMVVVFQDHEDERSVLEGFTIAGYVEDLEPTFQVVREIIGAGILCTARARPTLRDCVIAGHAAQYGGGVACIDGAAPRFSGCTVRWNIAFGGGGIYVQESSPLFEDCSISGNVAEWPDTGGGGVLCVGAGTPRFVRCKIAGNFGGCGSAVHVDNALPIFENCTIFGHPLLALEMACAVCDKPMFINCTISENEEDRPVCHKFRPAHFLNCILSSHWEYGWNPWGDNPMNLSDKNPRFVSEGIVDFGRWSEVTLAGRNIRVPDFIVEEPDFHLQPDSPSIDAGTGGGAPSTDIEEIERPRCGGIDIGAYEFSDCAAVIKQFRRGDCNNDGELGLTDVIKFLNVQFASQPETLDCLDSCDVDDDGELTLTDAIRSLNFQFTGTASAPGSPGPFECGPDVNNDTFPPCEYPPENCD